MVVSNNPIHSFYENYKKRNPVLILFLMVITASLYLIWWIFSLDKVLQKCNVKSPSSSKWVLYVLIFPLFLGMGFYFFENYFYQNTIIEGIKIILFYIIIILQLKFLYDFCVSLGTITVTNPLWWYYSMFFWILSIVLIYFQSYYTLIFMFFPITAIPAMQAFLNKRFEIFHDKELRENHRKHNH